MVQNSHPFGDAVRQHLSRRHGLSQGKLADGIMQASGVLSDMMRGRRLTGPQARERVISIVEWLYKQQVLATLEEANALLNAAGMAGLQLGSPVEKEQSLFLTLEQQSKELLSQQIKDTVLDKISRWSGSMPPIPPVFIGREDAIRDLKHQLGVIPKDGASSIQVLTAVRGWPGVGKTTIAAALAHDPDIQRYFSDGILWTSLGPTPDLFKELATWGRAIGFPLLDLNAHTVEEASAQLTALLYNKRILLIVDDVWAIEHVKPFRVNGRGSALLVTTRLPEVAQRIAPGAVYVLGVLSEEKALELLQTLAPKVVKENFEASRKLVRYLEGLPLAIQVAGRLMNVEANYGFGISELLTEIQMGAKLIEAEAPADRIEVSNEITPTVAALLQQSTNLLDPSTLDYFVHLAVLVPKPATFSMEAIKAIWQVEDPRPIIRTLVDRGLLESIGDSRFWIHPLLVMHARSLVKEG